jgi:Sec-independent protein secretion pathway component TatC
LLYEVSIILAKMIEKKRAQRERELDEDEDTAPSSVVQRQ